MPPPPQPRKWVAGETHRYLGRQYRLRIVIGPKPSVRLIGPFFVVTAVAPNDPESIRAQMDTTFQGTRRRYYEEGGRAIRRAHWLHVATPPAVTVRRMWKRWGSTTRPGEVLFNVDLVKAPLGSVEILVVHELVHLKFPNHGRRFWHLSVRACD